MDMPIVDRNGIIQYVTFCDWLLSLAVVQSLSRVRLCNPVDCSPPGSSVLHYLPEFVQIHAH